MRKILISLSLLFFGLFLFRTVVELPERDKPDNPSQVYTASHYLKKGVKETGIKNIVTAISLNYRAYDTFGETILIFTALCSVLTIFKREKHKISYSMIDVSHFKSSIIVQTVLTIFLPFSVLFAFYLTLYGTNSVGGGLQGGILLGSSMIIFSIIFGSAKAMDKISYPFWVFFEGAAVFTFVLVGLAGIIFGANFLTLIIPGISASYQLLVSKVMLILLQIGFTISSMAILISIFFSMYREETQSASESHS
ncbi:MAG: hypothetical protein HY776_01500 [Actinobacteria bacterium]|nr:hypothetical protein [Actinomycetota bacterium]